MTCEHNEHETAREIVLALASVAHEEQRRAMRFERGHALRVYHQDRAAAMLTAARVALVWGDLQPSIAANRRSALLTEEAARFDASCEEPEFDEAGRQLRYIGDAS